MLQHSQIKSRKRKETFEMTDSKVFAISYSYSFVRFFGGRYYGARLMRAV